MIPDYATLYELRKINTVSKIAGIYGVCKGTVEKWLHKYSITLSSYSDKLPDELSFKQKEIIAGTLLGDGLITNNGRDIGNYRFEYGQKSTKMEYVEYMKDILSPFSKKISTLKRKKPSIVDGKISSDINYWNGEWTYFSRFRTCSNKIFTDLRDKWYKDSRLPKSPKKVPLDLKLTWTTLAIWVCDDGACSRGYNSIRLCTDSFSLGDIDFLRELLKKFGIDSSIVKHVNHKRISIFGDSYHYLCNGIKEFLVWKCMKHKIGIWDFYA